MKKTTSFLLIIMVFFTLFGCSNSQSTNKTNKANKTTSEINKTSQKFNSSVYLKKIETNYNKPNSSDTPVNIILKSVKWLYSNGKTEVPNKSNIMFQQSFGNQSVIALKVSKLTGWYNFIIFQKGKDRWHFKGLITQSPEQKNKNKQGIRLPINAFSQTELKIDNENSVWSFTDSNHALLIGKSPRQPIDSKSFKSIKLQNGTSGWVISKQNKTFLFYYDKNQLVWILGDFSLSKITTLANSLPSSTGSNFPFKN